MDLPWDTSVLVEERNLWLDRTPEVAQGTVARVYPSRTPVSLMGCKRAEGVYMVNGRMGQRAVYRTRNRARKCAGPSGEKTLVLQSNKSLALLPDLLRGFSLCAFSIARLFPPVWCKLRHELRFTKNCIQHDRFFL